MKVFPSSCRVHFLPVLPFLSPIHDRRDSNAAGKRTQLGIHFRRRKSDGESSSHQRSSRIKTARAATKGEFPEPTSIKACVNPCRSSARPKSQRAEHRKTDDVRLHHSGALTDVEIEEGRLKVPVHPTDRIIP